jgi:hypothetical protein
MVCRQIGGFTPPGGYLRHPGNYCFQHVLDRQWSSRDISMPFDCTAAAATNWQLCTNTNSNSRSSIESLRTNATLKTSNLETKSDAEKKNAETPDQANPTVVSRLWKSITTTSTAHRELPFEITPQDAVQNCSFSFLPSQRIGRKRKESGRVGVLNVSHLPTTRGSPVISTS